MTSNNENRNQAVVAVIQSDSQLLTIKRSMTVRAPGQFCFPGGGIESGESAESALVREMQEELRIQVQPLQPIWTSLSPTGIELFWWTARIQPGQLIVPNPAEVESFHWLSISQIRGLPNLLVSNVAFLQLLDQGEIQLTD